jgi:hypothetical protein
VWDEVVSLSAAATVCIAAHSQAGSSVLRLLASRPPALERVTAVALLDSVHKATAKAAVSHAAAAASASAAASAVATAGPAAATGAGDGGGAQAASSSPASAAASAAASVSDPAALSEFMLSRVVNWVASARPLNDPRPKPWVKGGVAGGCGCRSAGHADHLHAPWAAERAAMAFFDEQCEGGG